MPVYGDKVASTLERWVLLPGGQLAGWTLSRACVRCPRKVGRYPGLQRGRTNMAFEIALWKVNGSALQEIPAARLDQEQRLEDWIAGDPSILASR